MPLNADQTTGIFLRNLEISGSEGIFRSSYVVFHLQYDDEDGPEYHWKVYSLAEFMEPEPQPRWPEEQGRIKGGALGFDTLLSRLQRIFHIRPETHEVVLLKRSMRNKKMEQVMDPGNFLLVLKSSVEAYFPLPMSLPGLDPLWVRAISFAIRPRRYQRMARAIADKLIMSFWLYRAV